MRKKDRGRRKPSRKPFRLGFEALEDRRLLAGMSASLYENILEPAYLAQALNNTSSSQTGQAAATGNAALSAAAQSTVFVNFTAEASTVIGTPFGKTDIRGRTFSGSFSYDSSTPATPLGSNRADYKHAAGTGSFRFDIDGTIITGSGAPVFSILNLTGSSDQFGFADGTNISGPFTSTTMFVNGAPDANVGVSLSVVDGSEPFNSTALPNPFPYSTNDFNLPHTFSLRSDSNNRILLQIRTSQQTTADTFHVTQLTPTSTGFEAEFNGDINANVLNLYSTTPNGAGASDITLVGATVGTVNGSVVVDSALRKITFIKTGGPLVPDDYTLTFRSAANGLVDTSGNLLDGDSNGTAGDDYVINFNVATPAVGTVTVGLPDFARGPGQPVVVPTSASGLPLTLSDGAGVTDVTIDVAYDPALLHIASAQVAPGMPAGATVSLDTSTTPGIATITFQSPTPLTAGAKSFVVLQAGVPNAATYRSTQLLTIEALSINGGAVNGLADNALQVVDLYGDANGDQQYTGFDASRISRVVVGLDTGFLSFLKVDPKIIADINSDASLTGFDASRVSRIVVGLSVPQIPALPGPNAAPTFTKGADQNLSPDSGPQSISDWATNISPGSPAEVGQSVTFQVTGNTNAALFSVAPQVSADGTLTYTPAAGASGSATITLVLKDNGGTAGGGVDTSASQTFVINIFTPNLAPVRTAGSVNNLIVQQDSGLTSLGLNAVAYSPGSVDEAGQTLSYRVTSVPPAGSGTVRLADGTTIVTAGGLYTLAQIRGMQFQTVPNQSGGPWTFSFTVKDNGGTAGGGQDTLVESLTIKVNPSPILGANNYLVANGNFFTVYSPTGAVIQKITIPTPPGFNDLVARDIVVDSQNRVHIALRGALTNFAQTLATLDLVTNTWSFHTLAGWTMGGVTYFGGIGINDSYVFVTDNETGPGPIDGIIRFPLADLNAAQRFHEVPGTGDNLWHQAKIGLDGFLYSLNRDGDLRRYNPDTMEILGNVNVYEGNAVGGVAVAANGHIYTVDGQLRHLDATGTLLESAPVPAGATDIEIRPDGTLIVGSGSSGLTVLNISNLTSQFFIDTSAQAVSGVFSRNFVAFSAPISATPVSPPASAIQSLTLPTKETEYDANANLNWAALESTSSSSVNSLTAISGAGEVNQVRRVTAAPSAPVDVVLADWMDTLQQLRGMKFHAATDETGDPVVFSSSAKDDGGATPGKSGALVESLTIQVLDSV